MRTPVCLLVGCLSLIGSGCSCGQVRPSNEASQPTSPTIQIDSLTVSDKDARLVYHIGNPFDHDIWVCDDMFPRYTGDDRQDVETRIIGDTLRVKLRFRQEPGILPDTMTCGRYRRVGPGDSCSGVILLDLPVGNASPIRHFYGPKQPACAHRVIFEIGYFDADLPARLKPTLADRPSSIRRRSDANTAFVFYLWRGLEMQHVVDTSVADVTIPCMALIKDPGD